MTPWASEIIEPTLAEMREHATTALKIKRLDLDLLARGVLRLCDRVEELEQLAQQSLFAVTP